MNAAVQFAVSLLAIVALAWLARYLGLGRDIRIRNEEHARELADEVMCGFEPATTAVDASGAAALLRDSAGTIILAKLHGAQFSGRVLGTHSRATIRDDPGKTLLEVDSGEWLFGTSVLDIEDAEDWAKAINGAGSAVHA